MPFRPVKYTDDMINTKLSEQSNSAQMLRSNAFLAAYNLQFSVVVSNYEVWLDAEGGTRTAWITHGTAFPVMSHPSHVMRPYDYQQKYYSYDA